MEFNQNQIDEILSLKESFKTSSFDDLYSQIENLTADFPIIYREQYRLYSLFCLYQIQKPKLKQDTLPLPILDFHKRLLKNPQDMSVTQIEKIWSDFGSSDFLNMLEIIANGNISLQKIIKFIRTRPGGKSWLDFLNENSDNSIKHLTPAYLSFIPTSIPSNLNFNLLISQEEYDQIKLKP